MKIFLIESINTKFGLLPNDDFSNTLIQSVNWHKWYYDSRCDYDYILTKEPERPVMDNGVQYYPLDIIVPVGSIEFVHRFLEKYYKITNIKPVNIPEKLMKTEYLKRELKIIKSESNLLNTEIKPIFVKSNSVIKGFTNIVQPGKEYPPGEYIVSEVVDIDSEWRCFVFKNQLVGMQNYSGDFTIFPDVDLINKMIEVYDNPATYTLDVGINKNSTFLIEVHNFYSCGLYGFSDYNLLPLMFVNAWMNLIKIHR